MKAMTISVLVLLLAVGTASARIINIPDDFETIQEGIDDAEDGDTVLVAPGEYVENINFEGKAISLIGDADHPEEVVIDGNGNGSVITIREVERGTVSIAGLSIRNGEIDNRYGGGIYAVIGANLSLSNLIIEDNHADYSGGGALAWADTLRLDNVAFHNNSSGTDGGGLTGVASIGSFRDCEFVDNHAGIWGGGLALSGVFDLTRCIVSGNETGWEDEGGDGCAISTLGSLRLEQSTVAGNYSRLFESGAILLFPPLIEMQIEIYNSIIFNDVEHQIVVARDSSFIPSRLVFDYSDLSGGEDGISILVYPADSVTVDWGEGNIDEDPLLVDPDNGDYRLTADSPCVDAGDPDSDPDPDGSRSDMGAFYYHQRDIDLNLESIEFVDVQTGELHQHPFTIFNTGLTPLTVYSITIDDTAFSIDREDTLEIAPESSQLYWLAFRPEEQAEYYATLTIISDDFDEDTLRIPIIANALGVVDQSEELLLEFTIRSIYPNPFNSNTTLSYAIPYPAEVTIRLLDLSGRVVAVPFFGVRQAGRYRTSISADQLSAGIYFLRLEASGVALTIKTVHIK